MISGNVSNPSASYKYSTSTMEMGGNAAEKLDNSTRFELPEASERTVVLQPVTISDMRSAVSESSDNDLTVTVNKSSTEEEAPASLPSTESLPSSHSTRPSLSSISSERNEPSTSVTDLLVTKLHGVKSTTSNSISITGSETSSAQASSQPTSSNVVSTTRISSLVDESVTTSSTGITADLMTSTSENEIPNAQTLPQATSTTESPANESITHSSIGTTTGSKISMDLTTEPKTESSLLTAGDQSSSAQMPETSSSDIESTNYTTFPTTTGSVRHSSISVIATSISETGNETSSTSISSVTESTTQISSLASELETSSSSETKKESMTSMHHSSLPMTTRSISTTGSKTSSIPASPQATSSTTETTTKTSSLASELETSAIGTIKDSAASTSHDAILTMTSGMSTIENKTSSILASTQPSSSHTEFTSIISPEDDLATTTSVETTDSLKSTSPETVPITKSSISTVESETSSTQASIQPALSSAEPATNVSSPADELVTTTSSGTTDSMTSTPHGRTPSTARSTSTTRNETSGNQTLPSTEFTTWISSPADESTTMSIETTTGTIPKESLSVAITSSKSTRNETSSTPTSPQPSTKLTTYTSSSTGEPVTALSSGTTIGTKSTASTYDDMVTTTTSSITTESETSSTLTSPVATSTESTTDVSLSASESVTSSSFGTTSETIPTTENTTVSLTPKEVQKCLKDLTEMEPRSTVTVVFSFSAASMQEKLLDNDSYEIRIHQSILLCLAMQHHSEEKSKDASKDGNTTSHLHLKRSVACVPPTFSEKGQNFSITFYVRELVNGAEKLIPANILVDSLNSCKSMIEKEVGLNVTAIFEARKEDQATEPSILQRHATLFIVLSAVLGIIIIVGTVAFVCFYFCRNSALYDTEKLKKDMPSSVEIGDIVPDDAILNDEMAERETFELPNGCDGHFVRMQEDGWVVPISQIPIEEKNPPVVQDTKL